MICENFCILDTELRIGALFIAVRYRIYVKLLTKFRSDKCLAAPSSY